MATKTKIVDREIETNGIKHMVKYQENVPVLCKTCKVNVRRNGSAFCRECADKFKLENK